MPSTTYYIEIENNRPLVLSEFYSGWIYNFFNFDNIIYAVYDAKNWRMLVDNRFFYLQSSGIVNLKQQAWDITIYRPFVNFESTKAHISLKGVFDFPEKSMSSYVPDYFPKTKDEITEPRKPIGTQNKRTNGCG